MASASKDQQIVRDVVSLLKRRLNVVLEGAPGTGKTYMASEIATRLCGASVEGDDRKTINSAFFKLVKEGRVQVVTFHPSLDYDDFVEGWRPGAIDTEASDDDAAFQLVPGIFKRICDTAHLLSTAQNEQEFSAEANVWKVSLLSSGDNPLRQYCLDNNMIRIGWDEYGEDPTEAVERREEGAKSISAFYDRMKVGDIVVSCYSSTETDAIGVVTGTPTWLAADELGHRRARSVKWLYKGKPVSILPLNDNFTLTLCTVYRLTRIDANAVQSFLDKLNNKKKAKNSANLPVVLIIDEINRGNVAKIFGELITLLEPDKREGEKAAMPLKLAYGGSKEHFIIPSNLYILATMNTSDRSIGDMDYALRRRFAFKKILPHLVDVKGFDDELFKDVSNLFVEDPESTIVIPNNDFFSEEFMPEDFWPGQSYFIANSDSELKDRWSCELNCNAPVRVATYSEQK